MLKRTLAIFGVFVAGLLAKRALDEKPGWAGKLTDRILRNFLFQSQKESSRTASRSAHSLVTEVIGKVYNRFMAHSVMNVAAAGAFFIVLAIFPGLAGLVALYSFLGDPAEIATFIAAMPDVIPADVVELIQSFLQRLISRSNTNLGTFFVGFGVALWSANSAMKSLIEALNIVYECRETRSILRLNLLATLMTTTFLLFMLIAINVMILPVWDLLVREFGGQFLRLRWIVLLFAVQVLISTLYYFAPCGRPRRWHFLSAGASLAALAWLAMCIVFSAYLTNFANYSITYGSLGAAAIFMTWLWLTVTILLLGAEVDATIENMVRKTAS